MISTPLPVADGDSTLEGSTASIVPQSRKARVQPGLHLIGDLYGCRCESSYMLDAEVLGAHCRQLVAHAGLTAIGDLFHSFGDEGGVTGMVVLAESHMSLHTWPEQGYVTLDVYVCNYSTDNRDKARHLFDALVTTFAPTDPRFHSIDRA